MPQTRTHCPKQVSVPRDRSLAWERGQFCFQLECNLATDNVSLIDFQPPNWPEFESASIGAAHPKLGGQFAASVACRVAKRSSQALRVDQKVWTQAASLRPN